MTLDTSLSDLETAITVLDIVDGTDVGDEGAAPDHELSCYIKLDARPYSD